MWCLDVLFQAFNIKLIKISRISFLCFSVPLRLSSRFSFIERKYYFCFNDFLPFISRENTAAVYAVNNLAMSYVRTEAKNFQEPLLKWAEKSVNDKKEEESCVTKINCINENTGKPDPMSFILAYQVFSLQWLFAFGEKRHGNSDENLIWRLCEHKHTKN